MARIRFHHVQLAMPTGGQYRARVFSRDTLGPAEVPRAETIVGQGLVRLR